MPSMLRRNRPTPRTISASRYAATRSRCRSATAAADSPTLSRCARAADSRDDVVRRALEPYVTTKAKGTGLGLAIVKKIAEEHHGRVTIGNRSPHGAVVTLYLPFKGTNT